LLWDASGSRARSDLGADLEALAEYLGDLGRASVHLLVFSNDVWLQEEHRITGGNAGPLIERLETLEPDGATSFGCLDLSDIEGPIDGVLLFSDGLETLSLGRPELEGRSVDVLTSASVVDRSLLEESARGGVLLDLKSVSTEQAVDALFEEPLQFLGAESQGGSVLDLEPRAPRVVSGGFSVSGRLGGTTPTALTLRFGHGGEVTEMVEVPLDPAGSSIGGAFAPGRVERTWARARIGSLLSRREENEDAITELGKRLSLVTPYTSLIVLETLEDYLRYEVEPPEPLRDEYLEALATKREAEAVETSREERVEALRLEWEERLAWWEREPAPPLEPEPPAASRIGEGGSVVALSTAPGVDGIEPVEPSEVYSHSTIRLSEERVITTSGSDERHLPGLQERSSEVSDITSDHPDLRAPPLELDDDSGAPTGEDRVVVRSNDEAPSAVVESRFIDLQELGGPEIQGQQYSLAASFACGLDEEEDEDVEWEPLPETATHYGSPGGERSRGIRLQAWSPGSPQGQALREAGLGIYERYLELRPEHARSPAFLLDSADLLLAGGEPELAIRVLSNLAELDLESPRLLRVLGHRLGQIGALDVAEAVFREVLRLRPEEPQSQRDLGLALAQQEKWDEAILALEGVVLEHWDDRFPGIERLVLGELNDVIARCREATGRSSHTLPEELVDPLDVDLRIVCTWDADACDVDLWVTEPGGEKAYYEHQDTRIGGHMSPDFTRGYGPEEYLLRRAAPGVYKIQCHYYGDRQQTLHGSTTIQVLIIKNLGRPDEERTAVTRRLDEVGGVVDVAEVSFP
ncbi:MAG: DUF2135 domain-containing protein, partial [Planctomycetota bacterium]